MKPRITAAIILTLAALQYGCGGCTSHNSTQARMTVRDFIPLQIGGVSTRAQIAISDSEQAKGLMFRNGIGEGESMLFPYQKPQRMSFWMNNVPFPLSIGFFDTHGNLLEIRRMLPNDVRTVTSASDRVQYALEVPDGWFARAGVKVGAKMDMQQLADALRARGERPEDYGITHQ
jgi:uncharacterized membrane protein (UPF0127 family)